jgi:hypothetical protein
MADGARAGVAPTLLDSPYPPAMHLEVRRDDLRSTRLREAGAPVAGDGEAVLRVSRFALTANNVTYAVFGDVMSYWRFFPADEGYGRVPVWGFADVVASSADGVHVGERVYGYLPMSTHLVVRPSKLTDGSFVDAVEHRAELPGTYNQYQRVDPSASPDDEQRRSLFQPLFGTAFLLDDWLDEHERFGAGRVVLASASSKTALGLAFLLSRRAGVDVVGLTSAANADFVASVGYYDEVVAYEDVTSLPTDVPTAFVDMAGGGQVLASVHRHLGDALTTSCLVGATHWEEGAAAAPSDLPGPSPSFFFAPDRVVQRRADWGPGGLEQRLASVQREFLQSVGAWLRIDEQAGLAAAAELWVDLVDGRVPPDAGPTVVLPA